MLHAHNIEESMDLPNERVDPWPIEWLPLLLRVGPFFFLLLYCCFSRATVHMQLFLARPVLTCERDRSLFSFACVSREKDVEREMSCLSPSRLSLGDVCPEWGAKRIKAHTANGTPRVAIAGALGRYALDSPLEPTGPTRL